jgi:DNA-binding transcriptional regulator YiaG
MDEIEKVDIAWVLEKIEVYNLQKQEIAKALGVDKAQFSKWISGHYQMSKPAKCAAWYYFKILELEKEIDHLKNEAKK